MVFDNALLIEALILALRRQGDVPLAELPRDKLTPALLAKLDKELAWLARDPDHRRAKG